MTKPLPAQMLPFTCGPACVAQVLIAHRKIDTVSLEYEIEIWRRANTVFMGPGLPGCCPQGLALELARKGLEVNLLRNKSGLFVQSCERSPWKRNIALGQQDLMEKEFLAIGGTSHIARSLKSLVESRLIAGSRMIALSGAGNSGRGREPHWILAWKPAGEDLISIYDPFNEDDVHVHLKKIEFKEFWTISSYGRVRERCYICISDG